MTKACNFEGCTVAETGVCALERDPATCDHHIGSAVSANSVGENELSGSAASTIGAPVLRPPTSETSSFPSSRTLGPDAVSDMMASRYVTVIGILGDPESGKTACLVSLYLLVSNAQLAGWSFRDSKTLMAFEDIARGAREWNAGDPPDQMTVHTELSDERRPGFLHLRLARDADGRRVDLVLPDLPGEWTTELVGTSRIDRFGFMKGAEVLWIVLDGLTLENKERRQGVISRIGQLAGRLGTLFNGEVPKLVLAITRRDSGELSPTVTDRLAAELAKRNLTATIVPLAPFSDSDLVKPGFGLEALIDVSTSSALPPIEFWPASAPKDGTRSYIAYRRDQ